MTQDSLFSRVRDLAAQYLPEAIAPREPTLKERVENVVEQAKDQAVDTLLDAHRVGTKDIKNMKHAVDNKIKDFTGDNQGESLRDLKKDVNAAKQHAQHAVEDARRRAERAKHHIYHDLDEQEEDIVGESKAKVVDQVQDVKDKIGVWWSSAKNSLDTESL
jgi:vacuolar-type H+-ATPase subunit H